MAILKGEKLLKIRTRQPNPYMGSRRQGCLSNRPNSFGDIQPWLLTPLASSNFLHDWCISNSVDNTIAKYVVRITVPGKELPRLPAPI